MPDDPTVESDPTISSGLPFLVDKGDERYYRVKGITLHLTDPKTGQVTRSVKLVHNLTATPADPSVAGGTATPAEEPLSLTGDHAVSLSLHVEEGPCNPQNPTCPPMVPPIASIQMPFSIHFVVDDNS